MLAECPECGEVVRFTNGDSGEPSHEPVWICPECGATFEEDPPAEDAAPV